MNRTPSGNSRQKEKSIERPSRARRIGQLSRPSLAAATRVTPVGGNVFADLGFAREEAENLRMRSLLLIALRRVIAGMPQREAALLLGTTQPRVSHLMRGRIDLFTIDSLVNMLAHAGARLRVTVSRPRPRSAA